MNLERWIVRSRWLLGLGTAWAVLLAPNRAEAQPIPSGADLAPGSGDPREGSLSLQQGVEVGEWVPDNASMGLVSRMDVSTPITSITRLTVSLELDGGFNGDLYAYLSHSSGFAVLLNRVGRTELDSTGYLDWGMSVVLDDAAALGDVHRYRETLDWEPLPGPLTGTWQPDGRTTDPVEVLDTDARTALLSSFQGVDPNGTWTLFVADLDIGGESTLVRWGIRLTGEPEAPVVGRYLAYNDSVWDGNNPALDAADDRAIAPDKAALRPGQRATFANYSSFSRGINCLLIDIAGMPGTPTLGDFVFRTGNTPDPSAWAAAAAPVAMTVRPGAGVAGSTRIGLRWADGAIRRQWLQVTVRATPSTGLSEPDVFYFGNAVGETGNSPGDYRVSAADALRVLGNVTATAAISNRFDINRDGRVGAADRLQVLANISALQPLIPLDLSGGAAPASGPAPVFGGVAPGAVERGESGLVVRWPRLAAPVRIWTSEAAGGGEPEIYDTLGIDRAADGGMEVFLPVDPEEPARFYQFESVRDP